jgi:ABC-type bacteriocin/lantibiotic exporter with double-glycine peptidase domain
MVDFYSSFLFFIILAIILIFVCIIFFISKIIKRIIDVKKREKSEREILNAADMIICYQGDKNIENMEELTKNINIPKNMKITKENDEIIIKYNNLVYNVSLGRFILTKI